MAIVDRIRRAVRSTPSASSSTSSSDAEASSSSSPSSSKATTPNSSTSRLSKTLSWRPKAEKKPAGPIHPADRPLTEANLRHQEMLSHFTMTFGRRGSVISDVGGVSPFATRRNSLDAAFFDALEGDMTPTTEGSQSERES